MTNNRIDEILREVRTEIQEKRSQGKYGEGYEASFELAHNKELGKLDPDVQKDISLLREALERLNSQIETLSVIERDSARFAPWRFVRELAMSRHQLIRLNQEVRAITKTIEEIASNIVDSAVTRTQANERASQELLDIVYERTLVMDKLLVICRELEARVELLEQK